MKPGLKFYAVFTLSSLVIGIGWARAATSIFSLSYSGSAAGFLSIYAGYKILENFESGSKLLTDPDYKTLAPRVLGIVLVSSAFVHAYRAALKADFTALALSAVLVLLGYSFSHILEEGGFL